MRSTPTRLTALLLLAVAVPSLAGPAESFVKDDTLHGRWTGGWTSSGLARGQGWLVLFAEPAEGQQAEFRVETRMKRGVPAGPVTLVVHAAENHPWYCTGDRLEGTLSADWTQVEGRLVRESPKGCTGLRGFINRVLWMDGAFSLVEGPSRVDRAELEGGRTFADEVVSEPDGAAWHVVKRDTAIGDGLGRLERPDGSAVVGRRIGTDWEWQCQSGDCANGEGKAIYHNHSPEVPRLVTRTPGTWEGGFADFRPAGAGVWTWASGERTSMQFDEDEPRGPNTWYSPDAPGRLQAVFDEKGQYDKLTITMPDGERLEARFGDGRLIGFDEVPDPPWDKIPTDLWGARLLDEHDVGFSCKTAVCTPTEGLKAGAVYTTRFAGEDSVQLVAGRDGWTLWYGPVVNGLAHGRGLYCEQHDDCREQLRVKGEYSWARDLDHYASLEDERESKLERDRARRDTRTRKTSAATEAQAYLRQARGHVVAVPGAFRQARRLQQQAELIAPPDSGSWTEEDRAWLERQVEIAGSQGRAAFHRITGARRNIERAQTLTRKARSVAADGGCDPAPYDRAVHAVQRLQPLREVLIRMDQTQQMADPGTMAAALSGGKLEGARRALEQAVAVGCR